MDGWEYWFIWSMFCWRPSLECVCGGGGVRRCSKVIIGYTFILIWESLLQVLGYCFSFVADTLGLINECYIEHVHICDMYNFSCLQAGHQCCDTICRTMHIAQCDVIHIICVETLFHKHRKIRRSSRVHILNPCWNTLYNDLLCIVL